MTAKQGRGEAVCTSSGRDRVGQPRRASAVVSGSAQSFMIVSEPTFEVEQDHRVA